MPLRYAYEPQYSMVLIRGEGEVSLADRVGVIESIMSDEALPEASSILVDVAGVANAPEPHDIHAIAGLARKLRSRFRGRIAILNTTVGHTTISQLVAMAADDPEVRAFVSPDGARSWLIERE